MSVARTLYPQSIAVLSKAVAGPDGLEPPRQLEANTISDPQTPRSRDPEQITLQSTEATFLVQVYATVLRFRYLLTL